MRLPHYLHRSLICIWHFRPKVPSDLIAVLGKQFRKKSLRTRDVLSTRRLALTLADRHAQVIRGDGLGVSTDGGPIGVAVRSAESSEQYELVFNRDG